VRPYTQAAEKFVRLSLRLDVLRTGELSPREQNTLIHLLCRDEREKPDDGWLVFSHTELTLATAWPVGKERVYQVLKSLADRDWIEFEPPPAGRPPRDTEPMMKVRLRRAAVFTKSPHGKHLNLSDYSGGPSDFERVETPASARENAEMGDGSFRISEPFSSNSKYLRSRSLSSSRTKTNLEGQVSQADIDEIYAYWRKVCWKTRSSYSRASEARIEKIRDRLREFSVADLKRALDGVACDDWEKRPRYNDLTIVFKSREAVERFIDMADAPPGRVSSAVERYMRDRQRKAEVE